MGTTPTPGPKRSRLDALKAFFALFDLRDAHAYTGILLLAVGLGFVRWQLALIVPGAILVYMGLRRVD